MLPRAVPSGLEGICQASDHALCTGDGQCIENGDVLTITYEKLLELYFQNPEFGYYFLRLTAESSSLSRA